MGIERGSCAVADAAASAAPASKNVLRFNVIAVCFLIEDFAQIFRQLPRTSAFSLFVQQPSASQPVCQKSGPFIQSGIAQPRADTMRATLENRHLGRHSSF